MYACMHACKPPSDPQALKRLRIKGSKFRVRSPKPSIPKSHPQEQLKRDDARRTSLASHTGIRRSSSTRGIFRKAPVGVYRAEGFRVEGLGFSEWRLFNGSLGVLQSLSITMVP